MKWITRDRPKIDRIACPWRVARFIDPDAQFRYVPLGDVLRVARDQDAIPYDVPGVELSHLGGPCSFDAFLKKYGIEDPGLSTLAPIVRGSDCSWSWTRGGCSSPTHRSHGRLQETGPGSARPSGWAVWSAPSPLCMGSL